MSMFLSILLWVGIAAILLVIGLWIVGKLLPEPAHRKKDAGHAAPAKADAHGKKDDHHPKGGGHDDHGHHPGFLEGLGKGLASIAFACLLFLAFAFGVRYLYTHTKSYQTSSHQAATASAVAKQQTAAHTNFVPDEAPVDGWLTLEGSPGYHIEVCRVGDHGCLETIPINYRMRCVDLTGTEVAWSPIACREFLQLKLQSTETTSTKIIWRYKPKP